MKRYIAHEGQLLLNRDEKLLIVMFTCFCMFSAPPEKKVLFSVGFELLILFPEKKIWQNRCVWAGDR